MIHLILFSDIDAADPEMDALYLSGNIPLLGNASKKGGPEARYFKKK